MVWVIKTWEHLYWVFKPYSLIVKANMLTDIPICFQNALNIPCDFSPVSSPHLYLTDNLHASGKRLKTSLEREKLDHGKKLSSPCLSPGGSAPMDWLPRWRDNKVLWAPIQCRGGREAFWSQQVQKRTQLCFLMPTLTIVLHTQKKHIKS